MKPFFETLTRALTKSDIYTSPEHNSVKSALKYIAILVVVISAIKAIILGFLLVPFLHQVKELAIEGVAKFPKDLVVTLSKGQVSMNKPSPYVVATPKDSEDRSHKNFIVIDTGTNLDFKAFAAYDTMILVTKDGYMAIDGHNIIKAQTFKNVPDMIVSKEKIEPYKEKLVAFLEGFSAASIVLVSILMWIVISIVGYAAALLLSLVGILATLAVTRIKKHTLDFSRLYALSLYAFTWVMIVGAFKLFLGFPAWIGALVFVLVLLAFVGEKKA